MKEKIASPSSGGGSPFRSSNLVNNGSFIENEKSSTLPVGSSKNSSEFTKQKFAYFNSDFFALFQSVKHIQIYFSFLNALVV